MRDKLTALKINLGIYTNKIRIFRMSKRDKGKFHDEEKEVMYQIKDQRKRNIYMLSGSGSSPRRERLIIGYHNY